MLLRNNLCSTEVENKKKLLQMGTKNTCVSSEKEKKSKITICEQVDKECTRIFKKRTDLQDLDDTMK